MSGICLLAQALHVFLRLSNAARSWKRTKGPWAPFFREFDFSRLAPPPRTFLPLGITRRASRPLVMSNAGPDQGQHYGMGTRRGAGCIQSKQTWSYCVSIDILSRRCSSRTCLGTSSAFCQHCSHGRCTSFIGVLETITMLEVDAKLVCRICLCCWQAQVVALEQLHRKHALASL